MKTLHLIGTAFSLVAAFLVSARAETSPAPGLSATDWSSIRGAYEAGRHAVRQQENGIHSARNPGQQWRTEFDGRGFLVVPDHGQWTWGMELQSVGSEAPSIAAAGSRISYRWGASLEEWFVNDRRGLEQGWTLHRPITTADTGGTAVLRLKIRGGLGPRISDDQRSVTFQTATGTAALTYGGLKAWDADGRTVDVRFARGESPADLAIRIDDRGAAYPITIDPIAQQAYLKAAIVEYDDKFGTSVAASGDTVVIGAVGEDGAATGVGGNQGNNAASNSGAAYVFVRDGGGNWSQQAYLKASNTGTNDNFGFSVAIDGNTIVVGANLEDSNATVINGDGANNGAMESGAAYVFVRDGGGFWSYPVYLKASNTGAGDEFGYSVAVSGDTVVVGSFWENNGSGGAYVFTRSGTTWSEQALLHASNSGNGDHFGASVAISGDTVIVGAILEDSAATGVNGNQGDDNDHLDSGAAYVFTRSGTVWGQQAYLKASNTNVADYFGWSVAVSGDTAVVGAEREDSNGPFAGAAYVFARSGTTWSWQAYLKGSNNGSGDRFGKSVATSGDKIVVGAYLQGGNGSGAAYVFENDGFGAWSESAYLKASNADASDQFGISVALVGDLVIVGAPGESSSATGVNGNQDDDTALFSGAVYVIDLNAPAIAEIAVEQPADNDLTSGVSTVDFGQVTEFENAPREFVIRSTGTVDLTGITASIVDNETGDFSVTTPPETLAPGTSTVVTVYFTPQGGGLRSGKLSIASDDPDENPFEIALTGAGVTYAWLTYTAAVNNAGLFDEDAEPDATPFNDGVSNLLKYAFNMNLAGPDSRQLATGGDSGLPNGTLIEEAGQKYWQFQFVWNLSYGLIYTPTKSTDLEIFEPMTGSMTTETIDGIWERVIVKEPVDLSITPKLFVRIEVTLP